MTMQLNAAGTYDVAIVGGGPGGMALACALGVLTNLKIVVVDKRPITTRDHSLRIDADGIDKIIHLIDRHLNRPNVKVNEASELKDQLLKWRKHNVRTSAIEDKLTKFGREKLNIEVHRDKEHGVQSETFDDFINTTGARVVIGADGDKSVVKPAIGANRVEEATLNYLLELKYSARKNIDPRGKIDSSLQASIAEGWDFETMGRVEPNKPTTVSLHKFIDKETHQALLSQGIIEVSGLQTPVIKGTPEHAWTMAQLGNLAKNNPTAKKIYDHIVRYFRAHDLGPEHYEKERIVTFPMIVGRSSVSAVLRNGKIVLLLGDANSSMVLNRGVNKAFKEVALCSEAIIDYFETKPVNPSTQLPVQFQRYQENTRLLFENEKWWAVWKNRGLNASEFLLKCAVRPLKWAVFLISIPFRIVLFPFRKKF